MSGNPTDSEIVAELERFVVESEDLRALETHLGSQNLFRILKIDQIELRHSNILAWMLDPTESHGLDDLFLRRWLIRIVNDAENGTCQLSPVDIDTAHFDFVEVRREWKHIDLLVVIETHDDSKWVIAIENKVTSTQAGGQLRRYREIVEKEFVAHNRFLVFLTRDGEEPLDSAFHATTYSQIHAALVESLAIRRDSIGPEPLLILENYQRLMEESFIENSDVKELALKIYKAHRRALDVIFEHRPDQLQSLTSTLIEELESRASEVDVEIGPNVKGYVRITPTAWKTHKVTRGGIAKNNVGFEISLGGANPCLDLVLWNCEPKWTESMWELAATAPFKRKMKTNGKKNRKLWFKKPTSSEKYNLPEMEDSEINEFAKSLADWVIKELKSDPVADCKRIMEKQLQTLPAPPAPNQNP